MTHIIWTSSKALLSFSSASSTACCDSFSFFFAAFAAFMFSFRRRILATIALRSWSSVSIISDIILWGEVTRWEWEWWLNIILWTYSYRKMRWEWEWWFNIILWTYSYRKIGFRIGFSCSNMVHGVINNIRD